MDSRPKPTPPERHAAPRRRTTRRGVRVVEGLASAVIRVGGVGTIAAVTGICVFLVVVALPLFAPAEARPEPERPSPAAARPLTFAVDELRSIAWSVLDDGRLVASALHDGALLVDLPLFEGARPSAASRPAGLDHAAFGFDDGSVRLARVGVAARYLDLAEAPPELAALAVGQRVVHEGGVAERISAEQVRVAELVHEVDAAVPGALDAPVVALGLSRAANGYRVVAADASGRAVLVVLRETRNMLTGRVALKPARFELPPRSGAEPRPEPRFAAASGGGESAWLAWADGTLARWDVREPAQALLVDEHDLVAEPDARLTALSMLVGQTTLVSGDSLGRVRGWFLVRRAFGEAAEGESRAERLELELTHELEPGPGAVVALAPSARSRVLAVAHEGGALRLHHVTSDRQVLALAPPEPVEVEALALAPRQDGLYVWGAHGLRGWTLALAHPDASLGVLFRPQWYEGYPEPEHVWQSTGGSDDFEPKLGLVPLVFGTLKATLYSMLFGVPLALLAAIYTSEFLSARWRTPVKSSIEMMASLPSVVLGFLAALVIAPFVQGVLSSVLASFFTIPAALLLGARLWQLMPSSTQIRLAGLPRLGAIASALPLGVLAARVLGPLAERALFGGDLVAWLGGGAGGAAGGWSVLLLPLVVLVLAFATRPLDERLRAQARTWSDRRYALADLAKFVALALVALASSWGAGHVLAAFGLDPRGSLVGAYVQRNALIVGFVMGFAIVPIVYTLAEDSLSSVPGHLRQASLGAGATTWQTAVRVVVPTAMSGLFSALMIGLGRAVGETMIVLMAAGNTPILEWNVFDGFRTLSANLAVELPEAVQGDTHYRTLFLAALVLFAMTFVLNTLAEIVRQRFRRRAWQL